MGRNISASEAREHLDDLMRQVVESGEPVTVQRGDEPAVVILSEATYRRLRRAERWRDSHREPVEARPARGGPERNRRGLSPEGGEGTTVPSVETGRRGLPPEHGERRLPERDDDLMERYGL